MVDLAVETFFARRETRQWLVVAILLLCMIIVAGPTYSVYAVFFTPLLKEFHFTRTQLSTLSGALFLSLGLSAPVIGWLLDRGDAKLVATAGTSLCVAGFVLAGRAHSLGALLIAHLFMGVGVAAGVNFTTPYVVANWFGARRGTALGVAFVGLALGPMSMTILAKRLLSAFGWRDGYFLLAIPMLAIALPLQLVFIRSRPPWGVDDTAPGVPESSGAPEGSPPPPSPGLEVGEALAARSFWLIAFTNFFFGFATTSLSVHVIPYLISIGYKPGSAALAMGITFGFAAVGNVFFGWLGDKVRSRFALSASLFGIALAVLLLLGATAIPALAVFIVIYGIAHQGPVFGVPLTVAESLGLRRFGSLSGLIGFVSTLAGSLGPVAAGRLFDATGSYRAPFTMFLVSLIIATILPLGCVPLAQAATGEPRLAAAH
ncbi:MAG TPA: MFS transporter [Candidatus Binataceae bacterium]|nr:MFS transporter [Candidatus Binataceae bacterium]